MNAKRTRKHYKTITMVCAMSMLACLAAGCGGGAESKQQGAANKADSAPLPLKISLMQVGDIPAKGNEVEQAMEKYTNTKLDFQWIPQAAFDEKVSVMIASNDMPQIMKVNYVPNVVAAMQSDMSWEIGPYLKDYKNLNAQDPQYYKNISIDGKIYGVPNFRDIGRAAIVYRKDWFDTLGLKLPVTLDDWYNVMKAMALNDPDKNGKNDTYGTMLFKKYNEGTQPVLTRIAVGIGGVNRWGVDGSGKFTPEFMTKEYTDVMKLFRRLFEEKLINQDFPAFDSSQMDTMMDNGRVGMKLNGVANNGKSFQERLVKNVPDGVIDVAPFGGPQGPRLAGEPGNFGFLAIPKSAVKTEADLKKVLTFLDKMMDPEMSALQLRGLENKHYVKIEGGKTEFKDLAAFQREVKPYRDNLVNIEGYNVATLKDTPIGDKGTQMTRDNGKYAVANPALTLVSAIYSERGKELDQQIWDAQTKFIMGKIDDAGWQAEVDKWRKAGGDQLIKEYEAAYAKLNKK
ncbi:extracellular solute-binding protein [Paenibacillus filicis]|uniref:Extracellular solute-binding protein n=1 Tax=Paenibacillus gyeongsangnamensis TaxID=3388067 RepID=A0ABT4QA91_9BACL|nr:extracellular solute-binding protein [Paenibacillus filicis]MCZ8513810.1 extracellular solute-binding protein [Paenibacillus filicis]